MHTSIAWSAGLLVPYALVLTKYARQSIPIDFFRHFQVWLNPRDLPSPEDMRCGECAHPLSFLVQLYCPIDHEDDAFHRCLYVFCCPKVSYWHQVPVSGRCLKRFLWCMWVCHNRHRVHSPCARTAALRKHGVPPGVTRFVSGPGWRVRSRIFLTASVLSHFDAGSSSGHLLKELQCEGATLPAFKRKQLLSI